jgi:hypothetical protein
MVWSIFGIAIGLAAAALHFLIAGFVLWLVAHQLAPAGASIRWTRVMLFIACTFIPNFLIAHWLASFVGDWALLVTFLSDTCLLLLVLRLNLWRSLIACAAYDGTLFASSLIVMSVLHPAVR